MEYVLPGAKLTAVGLVSSAYSHELWMSWSLTSSVFFRVPLPCHLKMNLIKLVAHIIIQLITC